MYKMVEKRKRKGSNDHDGNGQENGAHEETGERQPKRAKNDLDELTEMHETKVLLEQKKRLMLRNKENQRKIEELEKNLEKVIKEHDVKDKMLSTMHRLWNHMNDDLELILRRLPAKNDILEAIRVNLPDSLTEIYPTNVDDNLLKQCVQRSKDLFTAICESIASEQKIIEDCVAQVGDNSGKGIVGGLTALNNRLKLSIAEMEQTITTVQTSYRKTKDLVNSLNEELDRYKKLYKLKQEELEEKAYELKDALAKVDKLKEESENAKIISKLTHSDNHVKEESKPIEVKGEASQIIDQLKIELQNAKAIIQKREDELQQYAEKNLQLQDKIHTMDIEIQSEMHIKETETYKQMQQTLQKNMSLIEASYMRCDKMSQTFYDAESMFTTYKQRFETEQARLAEVTNAKILEMDEQLAKMTEELEAMKKKEVKLKEASATTSLSSSSMSSSSKHQSEAMDKQIQKYKRDAQKLRKDLEKAWDELSTYKMSKEQVRNEIQILKRHNREQARKIVSLEEQVKQLQGSTSSSKEKEAPPSNDIEAELQRVKMELIDKTDECQMYHSEIDAVAKELSELEETRTKLVKQVREKEEARANMLKEKVTAEKVQQILTEKTKVYEAQIKQGDIVRTQLEQALKSHESRARQSEELLKKSREETLQIRQVADKLRIQVTMLSVRAQETREENERLKETLQSTKEECADMRAKLTQSMTACKRTEEKLNATMQQLNNRTDNQELEDELIELRRALNCPVCHSNRRSCFIIRCSHTFCKSCIDTNIQVRNRKCPTCGIKFQKDDVHPLYL
jgi:E3 ubiquitin-protein ligase BRE1